MEKLKVVAEMLGGFEGYGQVCRYLINRGLEQMAVQIANFETQQELRTIMRKQGGDSQELFDFIKSEVSRNPAAEVAQLEKGPSRGI